MATTKKTTEKAAEITAAKETETKKATAAKKAAPTVEKVSVKKAVSAAEKKAPAKKAPAKKAPAKKAAEAAETNVSFFIEFGGVQVSVDEVIKNVKATYGKDAKEITVYLKPQDSKAYFVADGEENEMDVFFC